MKAERKGTMPTQRTHAKGYITSSSWAVKSSMLCHCPEDKIEIGVPRYSQGIISIALYGIALQYV